MRITLDPAGAAARPPNCSLCTVAMAAPAAAMRSVPMVLGCAANGDAAADRFVDVNIYVCGGCGLIQTDVGFDQGAYEVVHSHALGGVWERHRQRLAAFVRASGPTSVGAPRILEIGPSVNPIARLLGGGGADVTYIDAMPTPPFDLGASECYIVGTFPGATSALLTHGHGGPRHSDARGHGGPHCSEPGFDLVIASHVAEHAPNLRAFVGGLFDVLGPGGIAVLSIPDFRAWFEGRYWNAVTSEHLNYPMAPQIETLCDELDLSANLSGFDGHSLFMALRRGRTGDADGPSSAAAESRALLLDWIRDIQTTTERIERALLDRPGEVIVAGASHLAQYLTMMSDAVGSRASCVIDNAASKHGARLYGTRLRVAPFDVVAGRKDALVVIPPSPYRDEMERQVKSLNARAVVVS